MINYEEINKYLQDIKVSDNIIKNNQNELNLSKNMFKFTQTIFKYISKIKNKDEKEATLNKVLLLLFTQGYKSYKGCLSQSLYGYYTNTIILMRNVIEIIFNIKYILDEQDEIYNKVNIYMNDIKQWTNETIRKKAYIASNSTLYSLYGLSSDFIHANYLATSQNINKDGVLLLASSNIGIKKVLNLINAVYYFLLEYMSIHYDITFTCMDEIKKNDEFSKYYKTFYMYNFQRRYY